LFCDPKDYKTFYYYENSSAKIEMLVFKSPAVKELNDENFARKRQTGN
jgi:hypothetical protein